MLESEFKIVFSECLDEYNNFMTMKTEKQKTFFSYQELTDILV